MIDLQFTNHGSIITCEPVSEAGQAWLADHVDLEEAQFFGNAVAMEPRYAWDICEGARLDGLSVA